MLEEGDKEFIANELGRRNVNWEKIEIEDQDEGRKLSDIFYDIRQKWGYDTTDIFLVCMDAVFDDQEHLFNVLDAEITEGVMDYLRSLRNEEAGNGFDAFAV